MAWELHMSLDYYFFSPHRLNLVAGWSRAVWCCQDLLGVAASSDCAVDFEEVLNLCDSVSLSLEWFNKACQACLPEIFTSN